MTFDEWVQAYGIESARRAFGVSDHLVLTVYPTRVTAVCGRWMGSEPLANTTRNPNAETACQRLRDSLMNCFATEEIVYIEPEAICENCGAACDYDSEMCLCKQCETKI